jgi:hypothetical protein
VLSRLKTIDKFEVRNFEVHPLLNENNGLQLEKYKMKSLITAILFLGSVSAFASDDNIQSVDECVDKIENVTKSLGRAEIGLSAEGKETSMVDVSTETTFTVTLNWVHKKQAQLVYEVRTINIPGKLSFPAKNCVIKSIVIK